MTERTATSQAPNDSCTLPEVGAAALQGARTPGSIADAFRAGRRPTDRAFDRLLPPEVREVSEQYWTPIAVARRAAEWLEQVGVRTVVDIGSGAGKFCVASALFAKGLTFIGVEHRLRLVSAARDLATACGVHERVSFVHAAIADVLPDADAYYLYNPFGENLFGPEDHLDQDVELGDAPYMRDIAVVESLLKRAPVGTHLLTYNGFGGSVPKGYKELRQDRDLPNLLRLWKRVDTCVAGGTGARTRA